MKRVSVAKTNSYFSGEKRKRRSQGATRRRGSAATDSWTTPRAACGRRDSVQRRYLESSNDDARPISSEHSPSSESDRKRPRYESFTREQRQARYSKLGAGWTRTSSGASSRRTAPSSDRAASREIYIFREHTRLRGGGGVSVCVRGSLSLSLSETASRGIDARQRERERERERGSSLFLSLSL